MFFVQNGRQKNGPQRRPKQVIVRSLCIRFKHVNYDLGGFQAQHKEFNKNMHLILALYFRQSDQEYQIYIIR